jgi:hypothetical protein
VGAPKGPHEVARVAVSNPPANLLHRQVGLDQQTPFLRHAALGDPLPDRPPRLMPYDRGEVALRQAYRSRHVLERDPLAVAPSCGFEAERRVRQEGTRGVTVSIEVMGAGFGLS